MLEINLRKNDRLDMQVLAFAGELDLSEKERVRDYLQGVLADNPKGLIVDVTEITFMDSSGIGLFLSCYAQFKDADIRMAVLLSDNNYLMQKFRHLGIFGESGIAMYASRAEAEAAVLQP
ncbi:MAG TPA: STAS domain-containing protein [Candidatus Aquicultor sp.]|jgi:anti-sigma B factor antagonist